MSSFPHLVWALGHSLWQAVLVAALLWLALRITPTRLGRTRYGMALAALVLVVFGAWVTWSLLEHPVPRTGPAHLPSTALEGPPRIAPGDASPGTITRGAATPTSRPIDWTRLAGFTWLAGVALMLVRIGAGLGRARALLALGTPATLPEVDDLACRMRLPRVRVLVSAAYRVPAVIGALSPVLLVPAAILSNMSPAQLRMIFAHELAHVRRWDFLVNLVQQVIEALFFFNPAAWWISRQIRTEREACCDAAAVELNGDGTLYAETLTLVAARLATRDNGLPMAALAATGPRRSPLVERVRRLLHPATRSPLVFPARTLTLALVVSAAVLAAIGSTAQVAVLAAEKLLTPAERVEKIAQLQKELGSQDGAGESEADVPQVELAGTVRTEDGQPLPRAVQLHVITVAGHSSVFNTAKIQPDGRFTHRAKASSALIYADAPGYAPAVSDPLRPGPDGKFSPVDLVLTKGFEARIQLLSPDGKPIPAKKAEVKAWHTAKFGSTTRFVGFRDQYTVEDGILTIEHALPMPVRINIDTPGYQYSDIEVPIVKGQVATAKVLPARATRGTVSDADTGAPIAGAKLWLVQRDHELRAPRGASRPDVIAETDAAGGFTLDRLQDDIPHALWVSAAGHGSELVTGVLAGQRDLVVRLGKPRVLRFEIHPAGDPLPKQVNVSNPFSMRNGSYYFGIMCPVVVQPDGTGVVELEDPLPGNVQFSIGDVEVKVDAFTAKSPVVVDLRRKAPAAKSREVIVKLETPNDGAVPRGKIRIDYDKPDPARSRASDEIDIKSMEARLTVAVPSRLGYRQGSLVGYWVKEEMNLQVPDAPGPFEVTIPLTPAGAIHGRVLDDGGNLFTPYFYASVSTVELPPQLSDGRGPYPDGYNNNEGTGRFLLSPLALGGTYRVTATAGARYAETEPFVVDTQHPIREVELRFRPGITARIRVLDSGGQPVPRANVELKVSPRSDYAFGTSVDTDHEGWVAFEGVDIAGTSKFDVGVRPGSMHAGVLLKDAHLTQKPLEIRVSPGLTARGRVLDLDGKPIADHEVSLTPAREGTARYPWGMTARTDANGVFEARGLEPIDYTVSVQGTYSPRATVLRDGTGRATSVQHTGPDQNPILHGGSTDLLEIQRMRSPWN
jgi:beta-lactamase regulating signal transducer with metallopeptidase domain/protocatechuate 3,4-dioxygenase beta subunit